MPIDPDPEQPIEDWMFKQREAIAAHIAEGFAQAERGELIDGDAVIAMLRQRRAERLRRAITNDGR